MMYYAFLKNLFKFKRIQNFIYLLLRDINKFEIKYYKNTHFHKLKPITIQYIFNLYKCY